jgi:hypothetical protein
VSEREDVLTMIRGRNVKGGVTCLFCTPNVSEELNYICDIVIETQDEVSIPGILYTLQKRFEEKFASPIDRTPGALRVHFECHDPGRFNSLNLIRRGPLIPGDESSGSS